MDIKRTLVVEAPNPTDAVRAIMPELYTDKALAIALGTLEETERNMFKATWSVTPTNTYSDVFSVSHDSGQYTVSRVGECSECRLK